MNEAGFWNYLRNGLKGKWVAERIENSAKSGTPDVAYSANNVHGWIELKHRPTWPKRSKTPVRLHHFTNQQRIFLTKHGKAGGHCFLFLKVEKDYLLFHNVDFFKIGVLSKQELCDYATWLWHRRISFDELLEVLTK